MFVIAVILGPPVVPFYPFLGEGSPTQIDYITKGTLILTSLLEDLASLALNGQTPDGDLPPGAQRSTWRRGHCHAQVSGGTGSGGTGWGKIWLKHHLYKGRIIITSGLNMFKPLGGPTLGGSAWINRIREADVALCESKECSAA